MSNRLRPAVWVGIMVLVASSIVVSIGVAAFLQQRNAEKQAAEQAEAQRSYSQCISAWGSDLVETINQRSEDRERRDAARDAASQARDDALARVARVLTRLREQPPRATETDVTRALDRVAETDRAVRAADRAARNATPPSYKDPILTCGRTP